MVRDPWWEAEQLAAALAEHLGGEWRAPVTPLVLTSGVPAGLTEWNRVAVREPSAALIALRTMAAPWSRAQAAHVAAVADDLCRPA